MSEEISTFRGAGAKLLYDVCGPTARYLGEESVLLAKVGVENLKNVFEKAHAKLVLLKKTDGSVPPRIIKNVLEQGYFCEDEVQATYLGGILASSKSSISRDDRAISYLSLLNTMSTYQIRTHFILYSSLLKLDPLRFEEMKRGLFSGSVVAHISDSDYIQAMEYSSRENPYDIASHAFIGLQTKGLIVGGHKSGGHFRHELILAGHLKPGPLRVFRPTHLGSELFMWGAGVGEEGSSGFDPALLQRFAIPVIAMPIYLTGGRVENG